MEKIASVFMGSGVSLSSSDSDVDEIYWPRKGESESETEFRFWEG